MSRILPLSEDAISQVHSSKHITSLQGVVASLLENSLDAGATKVYIDADFRRGACTVEDNGRGIPVGEFEESGGLCKMHHTSKRLGPSDNETHGSHGTFLASLSALSLLSITSRHEEGNEDATLIMHRGKAIARHLPSPRGYELRVLHGTKIVVRDLFGNMPVRTKQRALNGESGLEEEKEWQVLKHSVVALLLAWPRPCTIKLSDAASDIRNLTLTSGTSLGLAVLTERALNTLNGQITRHDLRDALPILFQAGLAPQESRHQWIPVSAYANQSAIKGLICLDPAPTKHCQFVSIGIHPNSSSAGYAELYETINRIFATSSFGTNDDTSELDDSEKDRRKRDRRYKSDGYTQRQLHGRKAVDRWPRFILQIRMNNGDLGQDCSRAVSEGALKAVLDILEATVVQWLTTHHFRPRKRRGNQHEERTGPAAARPPLTRAQTALGLRSFLTSESAAATPTKRAATAIDNLDQSRKRRVIDLSGDQAQLHDIIEHRPSSYFNSLSRIKYGQAHERPKSASGSKEASTSHDCEPLSRAVKPMRHPFTLPSLKPGQLSNNLSGEPEADRSLSTVRDTSVQAAALANLPSEDFGSFDDAALADVAERAEASASGTVSTGAPLQGDNDSGLIDDKVLEWKDPKTKHVHRVNARTGVVLPHRPQIATRPASKDRTDHAETSRPRAAIDTAMTNAGRPLRLASRDIHSAASVGGRWLHGFLKDWDNPVFKGQDEEQIPVTMACGPGIDVNETHEHRCSRHVVSERLSNGGQQRTSQLSKPMLQQAKVVAQVDAKFILCLMNGNHQHESKTLVLVDQHAASERIILEQLLAELCSSADPGTLEAQFTTALGCSSAVKTVVLEKAIHFEVSEREGEVFRQHASHLAAWGILYDLETPQRPVNLATPRGKPHEHRRLVFRALPSGIAERCTLFPSLLIELLRTEAWNLASSGRKPHVNNSSEQNEPSWLRRIGSCPKGIMDMLNSRACRSAIMFNDVLSTEQCEKLMEDLCQCVFPFMCAHGRVSMVPLVSLRQFGETLLADLDGRRNAVRDEAAEEPMGFKQAFTRWMAGDRDIGMQNDT